MKVWFPVCNDVKHLIRNIRLLALDSDGVLTDGGVYVLEDGTEFRRFDIKDGLGLKQIKAQGIEVAVISTSLVEAVRHRCRQLGVLEVHLGVEDKLACLQNLCARLGITLAEVAYIGDDLLDLPVLKSVGLPCTPSDAPWEIREVALYVSRFSGGHGTVREICTLILLKNET